MDSSLGTSRVTFVPKHVPLPRIVDPGNRKTRYIKRCGKRQIGCLRSRLSITKVAKSVPATHVYYPCLLINMGPDGCFGYYILLIIGACSRR
jgi:hypothetical protein